MATQGGHDAEVNMTATAGEESRIERRDDGAVQICRLDATDCESEVMEGGAEE